MKEVDIVIVGAGMVGSLLAALLKDAGLDIVLLERGGVSAPERDDPFEPRVSALTRASENLLRHAGAWEAIAALRCCPYTRMEVWDGNGTGRVEFSAAELGETHLGVMVENRLLQWSLTEAAKASPRVTLRCPAQLVALERLPARWLLTLDDGEQLAAQLVIGADGAQSAVRRLANIGVREHEYGQRAIVTTIYTENPHDDTARQRFAATGPLALLPLRTREGDTHQCSIVWSQDEKEAQRLLALDDAAFCRELGFACENVLGVITGCDSRYSFPLRAVHSETYTRDGLTLIGDAAHAIHPLAGQGVNLGLLDAAVLAEEIVRAQARALPWWGEDVLARYSRRRRAHNTLILNGMTVFQKLFGSEHPALVLARNLGLSATNGLLPVKQEFARVAMGLAGDLPALARAPAA
ncbi:MAG: 2-octaprenyl-3-methyl-6-methoxy,4-benzoquinol hydroxylase [Moraxellaceae bacterium]|jgi:2-octaprenylphenol hydroxylase|nr:2-octaprenyl-3-methyl-6-methoxy,4-benzoquinol hydroxylase [Moraxellaceae bacterium]